MTEEPQKKIELKEPKITPEIQAMIDAQKTMQGSVPNFLKDENRYFVMLKLFDPKLLHWITQLDKEKAETMTRHDTLAFSMQQLGGLTDEQAKPFMMMKNVMHDSYALHQIPLKRQARKEVVEVLKDTIEHTVRSVGDKLKGRG